MFICVSNAGAPVLNKIVWIILQLVESSSDECPFLGDQWTVERVLTVPILALLLANFLFLSWVVIVSQTLKYFPGNLSM